MGTRQKLILSLVGALILQSAGVSAFAADEEGDRAVLKSCFSNWGKHPFKADSPYRTISAKVKVLGIGGDVDDTARTDSPELILVKPTVSVMSKTTLKLFNPNGWYCVKGRVSVLGKNSIEIHCRASLASSSEGATILGSSGSEGKAVTVLGASEVKRVGDCTP